MAFREIVIQEFKRRKIYQKEFVALCQDEAKKRGVAFDDAVIYRFLRGSNSTSLEKFEIMCDVLNIQLIKSNI